jgi:quinol monooxygenase YgiN
MMTEKGIFLVSLNSKKLDEFLTGRESIRVLDDIENLDVFVFDVFEDLNGLFFNTGNIEEQHQAIETTIKRVQKNIIEINLPNRKLIRFSELQKKIKPYLIALYSEYYSNDSFKHHCKSQIFQNLQPKLRSVGIESHKSNLIDILCPFLLAEIAFYLYAYHVGEYKTILGLENEMEILQAIKNKKYQNFLEFLNFETPHIKVNY